MSETNRSLVQQFFEEVCNRRNLALAERLFSADHAYHDPSSPGIAPGPQGIHDLVSTYQNAFPDVHWNVDEMLVAGDTVVTRWTGTGTDTAGLPGLAPTGRSVVVKGIWIHRCFGGRFVESWNVWDNMGMLKQLGLVSEPQRTARRGR
jgi:steroid delta-isomerase-like uncharacterized protein